MSQTTKAENTIYASATQQHKDKMLAKYIDQKEKTWSTYGKNTEAGRMLLKMYGGGKQMIQIDYPKPKQKTKEQLNQEKQPIKIQKTCPQKTVIEYPHFQKQEEQQIFQIDNIPKRKKLDAIQKEIDQFYKNPIIPQIKGGNRDMMKENLQNKFKFSKKKILPTRGEQAEINSQELVYMQQQIHEKVMSDIQEKQENKIKAKQQEEKLKNQSTEEQLQELDSMFENIVAEIEERQQYLDEIEELEDQKLKDKIKKQIIERVSELQKVNKLKYQLGQQN